MKYQLKKFISVVLGAAVLALFASCTHQSSSEPASEPSTVQNTTVEQTTAPQKTATEDSAAQEATYNLSRLKENSANLMSRFDSYISANKFNGVVYNKIGNDFEYISQTGQSVVEEHKSNSVNTRYYVGSLTKQFTAVAIMKLAEEKKLSVSNKLSKYFDGYKYGDKITIKNLLTMTSGLPSYTSKNGSIDSNFYTDSQVKNYDFVKNDKAHNKAVILEWILKQELISEPDTAFSFSDSNYYLLGIIIEKVAGTSYEDYMQKNIFSPLGMKASSFAKSDDVASCYDGSDDCSWIYYDGVGFSSTGLITSVSDILKWINVFDEYKIISKESVDEMCTPYLENYAYGFFSNNSKLYQQARFGKYSAMLEFTRNESEIFIAVSNYNYNDPVHLYAMFNVYLKPYSR